MPAGGPARERRVIKAGHSSVAVTLPKPWAKALHLRPGDSVVFDQSDDGSLFLRPSEGHSGERGLPPFQVEAAHFESPGELEFLVSGAYRAGHDSIEILSDVPLTPEAVEEVQATARRLLGVSVVAQEPNRLLVQSCLDPSKYALAHMIQRMRMILAALADELARALDPPHSDRPLRLSNLSEELEKTHAFLVRQLQLASRDWSLARHIGSPDPRELLSWRVVVQSLDEAGRLLLERRRPRHLPPSVASVLSESFAAYKVALETVVDALVHPSLTRACEARERVKELFGKLDGVRDSRHRGQRRPALPPAASCLRQSALKLRGLVDVAMDRAVTSGAGEGHATPSP